MAGGVLGCSSPSTATARQWADRTAAVAVRSQRLSHPVHRPHVDADLVATACRVAVPASSSRIRWSRAAHHSASWSARQRRSQPNIRATPAASPAGPCRSSRLRPTPRNSTASQVVIQPIGSTSGRPCPAWRTSHRTERGLSPTASASPAPGPRPPGAAAPSSRTGPVVRAPALRVQVDELRGLVVQQDPRVSGAHRARMPRCGLGLGLRGSSSVDEADATVDGSSRPTGGPVPLDLHGDLRDRRGTP